MGELNAQHSAGPQQPRVHKSRAVINVDPLGDAVAGQGGPQHPNASGAGPAARADPRAGARPSPATGHRSGHWDSPWPALRPGAYPGHARAFVSSWSSYIGITGPASGIRPARHTATRRDRYRLEQVSSTGRLAPARTLRMPRALSAPLRALVSSTPTSTGELAPAWPAAS